MAEDKKMNPLWLGLGLVAGAAGALFFSDKKNRTKTAKAFKQATQSGKSWFTQALDDLSAFADQGKEPIKKKTTKK